MSDNDVSKYKKKRDFRKTPEPVDDNADFDWAASPVFVIHKHDASNLHYDFRLEVDGVLKSWAVPKGPSTDPGEKRMAIPTEDHPLEYADFEGVIPEDQYGGGTVMVWDRGGYENIKNDEDGNDAKSLSEQINDGHVTFRLKGEKIKGGYALIHTGQRWLLIKMDDDEADAKRNPTSTEPRSVKTGRTLEEIRMQDAKSKDHD
jgi:DNA ligase D-like protein (predicted 3'-phosphoesterase)